MTRVPREHYFDFSRVQACQRLRDNLFNWLSLQSIFKGISSNEGLAAQPRSIQ